MSLQIQPVIVVLCSVLRTAEIMDSRIHLALKETKAPLVLLPFFSSILAEHDEKFSHPVWLMV